MSDEKDVPGGVTRVLGKLGLWNLPETPPPDDDDGPGADAWVVPSGTGTVAPEALDKLRADIGLDDPASPYGSFMALFKKLEATIPDVVTRHRAALDIVEMQQPNASHHILGWFDIMRSRFEEEGRKRMAALDLVIAGKVEPKKAKLAEARAKLEAKRNELASLEAEEAELVGLLKADEDAFSKIAADMGAALDAVQAELKSAESAFRDRERKE
jgi:hypothetical protein